MNRKLNEVAENYRNNTNDETIKAELTALAVDCFKTTHTRIEKAVRTINRHIGEGKGTPNRAKLAMAVGLRDDIVAFADIAKLIGLAEMEAEAQVLLNIVDEIAKERATRTYAHFAYLPPFLTDAEKREERIIDVKWYIYNIVNAVNDAIINVNKHIAMCDFAVNSYKTAKAIGYKDEIALIRAEIDGFITPTEDFTAELTALNDAENAIVAIMADKVNGFINGIALIADYNPFPNEEGGENGEDGENANTENNDGELTDAE